MIDKIRVSAGSADVLGLRRIKMKAPPTTLYFMTYTKNHCRANCGFCPQARESESSLEHLSRVTWPAFEFRDVLDRIVDPVSTGRVKRVCIQTVNFPGFFEDLKAIVDGILSRTRVDISCAISPLSREQLAALRKSGVQRVGIALDACTPELFDAVKGKRSGSPYSWEGHMAAIRDALEVFGRAFVSTHFIVGLGESEVELLEQVQEVVDLGVTPSLFAFTPVKGTALAGRSQPDELKYRKAQLGRFLIVTRAKSAGDFVASPTGEVESFGITRVDLEDIAGLGTPFQTAGCPGCNRPFYTSTPGGTMYNYPRPLTPAEKARVVEMLEPFTSGGGAA
ncbi:MAG: radical SAM protein [Promethearchaeota archaeon]